jgi:HAD superfamily hydrolase (TIGR01509 family)
MDFDPTLIDGVRLLSLDAGNTIVFLDHDALAEAAAEGGYMLDRARLPDAYGAAIRALGSLSAPPRPDPEIPSTWNALMCNFMLLAGITPEQAPGCTRALWRAHRRFGLWRRIPEDLPAALTELRATGVRLCVVSNAEGNLEEFFGQLGIAGLFDLIIDSHVVGVEKPDPVIFGHALRHFGVSPDQVLHLGDVVATDVLGARAAGIRAALLDPAGHYAGLHPDVPRVPSAAAVARAICARHQKSTAKTENASAYPSAVPPASR